MSAIPGLPLVLACCIVESVWAAVPIGSFDAIDATGAAIGWALDADHQDQPVEVEFQVDRMDAADAAVARGDAELPRLDVNAGRHVNGQHGFTVMIPGKFRDGRPHQLYAYALSADGKRHELSGSPRSFTLTPASDFAIKGDADIASNGISVATAARFAGAIASVRWGGMEFIDTQDHGREIQTAWQGNDAGECFNPTEAGSAYDGFGLTTTSEILSLTTTATSIETVVHPAFWLRAGEKSQWCGFTGRGGSPWKGGSALNRRLRSASTLKKIISLGYEGIPNVLVYDAEITFAPREVATLPLYLIMLENPAVYLRQMFRNMWRFDFGSSGPLQHREAAIHFSEYAPLPVIAATDDRRQAIAIYTPEIPRDGFPAAAQRKYAGYGFTNWGSTVSINARQPVTAPQGEFGREPYKFRSFIVIGNLDDVAHGLRRVIATATVPHP